jgi:N-acetylglucosamine-6-phosphate deacetylase
MVPFHHRDPGIIGVLGCNDLRLLQRTYYSCIVDGIHTHPASVKMAYHSHPEGMVLVTDAMCAMGLQEGRYSLGQMSVVIECVDAHNASQIADANGKEFQSSNKNTIFASQKGAKRAVLEGTNTLAGSIATLNDCVQNFYQFTSCSLVEAIEAATLHPAEVLGITHCKGTLNYGADADLILLDDSLNVKATWIHGTLIWHDENFLPEIHQNV